MRLQFNLDSVQRDLDVARFSAKATLADLVENVTGTRPAADSTLWLDDREVRADSLLARLELLDGMRISREPLRPALPLKGWSITQAGGLEAGGVLQPPVDRPLAIGRSPQADLSIASASVSWDHVHIQRDDVGLRVIDQGSTNGTFAYSSEVDGLKVDSSTGQSVAVDTTLAVGGSTLLLRESLQENPAPRAGSLHNVTLAGTVPFNRPPRPGQPPRPDPIVCPEPKEIADGAKFNIIAVVAPLVMAVAMVVVMKNPMYAMFAALSPVMAVGSWYEQKSRRKQERKSEDKRFALALETLRRDLAKAASEEAARRRVECPDPATTLRVAAIPTTQLWQRRFGAHDFLSLHAGVGAVPWDPPVERSGAGRPDERVRKVIAASMIPCSPVEVNLSDAGVVGIVGDRDGALALARSLVCQAAVHSGPADVTIGVFCDQGRETDWEWTTWLPHTRRLGNASADRWFSHARQRSNEMLRGLRDEIQSHPTMSVLLVLDSDVLTEGRESPARSLLGFGRHMNKQASSAREMSREVSGIVIAAAEDQLPAACTVVVTVADDAAATVTRPDDLKKVDDVVLAGVTLERAQRCALDLARFEDPELKTPGAALPSLVRLPPLIDLEAPTAGKILHAWETSRGVSTPVGVGENGVYSLDIVKDGPHGLVGGTTGSGKSEFLRSMVAGLAACNAPTKLTFILIDFKGGAAFAACERLPHTIGTISNLDEQLANRALRALEAEMEYRQRLFAAAGEGVDNLDAYIRAKPSEPLPRLLLVVDEFAMLAKDFPEVLSSLVRVATVGRTLGVHMILATQRPAGVVNDDILANTNLRVALRVQSREDSNNVIGVPDAAAIANAQKGRAYVKLGQDDITPVQTALVTGAAQKDQDNAIEIQELRDGVPIPNPPKPTRKDAKSDLDLLIDAIVEANEKAGYAPPRPVWPEALGERVDLAGFETGPIEGRPPLPTAGEVVGEQVNFAVSDDPDRQRQIPGGWDMAGGNLMLVGIPGFGTTTACATVALTLAQHYAPKDLDLIVLDMGARDLEPLEKLPHTSAYVGSGAGGREKQMRLLRFLRQELETRRATSGPYRRMVIIIDGLAALRDEYQDFEGMALLEGMYRAYADGPDLNMHFVITTSRARAIPSAIDEVTTQKWMFRLADPYDYSTGGLKPAEAPSPVPGRCVPSVTKLQTHVATPSVPLSDAVAVIVNRWGAPNKEQVVRELPDHVSVTELDAVAHLGDEPWRIPIGLREADMAPQYLELYEGEHMLIAGPARSGKSTLLMGLAESLRTSAVAEGTDLAVWGIGSKRSPIASSDLDNVAVGPDEIPALVAAARMRTAPLVLLIDDAERFDDADQSITDLVGSNLPHVHVIAAGRSDDLRSLYSHWTKVVRKSRCGVLLVPNRDYDGELLGITVPRSAPVRISSGRGYACMGGQGALIQAMSPTGSTF